jgi:hypothetical protein
LGVELSDVWYVPACKHTLISVKALQRMGCWAIIKDNWIQYFDASNKHLFLAVETGLGFEIQWDLHVPVKHIPVTVHVPEGTVHHTTPQHNAQCFEPAHPTVKHNVLHPTVMHNVLTGDHQPLPFFSDTDLFDICEPKVQAQGAQGSQGSEGVLVQYITGTAENAILLHARTGHMSLQTLAKMVKEGYITGVNVTAAQLLAASQHTCGICAQAKFARTPFKAS